MTDVTKDRRGEIGVSINHHNAEVVGFRKFLEAVDKLVEDSAERQKIGDFPELSSIEERVILKTNAMISRQDGEIMRLASRVIELNDELVKTKASLANLAEVVIELNKNNENRIILAVGLNLLTSLVLGYRIFG